MKKRILTALLTLFLLIGLHLPRSLMAQENGRLSLSLLDSLPPLLLSGLSPVVLAKEGVEVSSYNSLTSFWLAVKQFRPDLSETVLTNRFRFTALDHIVRVSYGFSDNQRWDLGAEFRYSHRRIDDEARSSPFRVFEQDEDQSSQTVRGFAQAGARVRYMPFRQLPNLTLQAAFFFPTANTPEEKRDLGFDRKTLDLAVTFYEAWTPRTYYYLQAGWQTQFAGTNNDLTTHLPSVSGFIVRSLFYHRFYVYPGLTYSTALQNYGSGGLKRSSQQLLGGLGLQYQPVRALNISLLGQVPFILESGSSSTEWVRESYSSWTLGLVVRI